MSAGVSQDWLFNIRVQFKPYCVTNAKGEFNVSMVKTYCDMCDSNNCNGWTLRAMPDSEFSDQYSEEGEDKIIC